MNKRPRRAAFTFAEVLAALVFMAIIIPVVMQGLTIGNRASVVAERKQIATRLADNLLSELTISNEWQYAGTQGNFDERLYPGYQWELQNETWTEDTMRLLTLNVTYPVQGREYQVYLSTLVDEATDSTEVTE